MWFFIILLILALIFGLGDIAFWFAIYGLVLLLLNWFFNKLFKPEEHTERQGTIILIGKIIFFLLFTIWFW